MVLCVSSLPLLKDITALFMAMSSLLVMAPFILQEMGGGFSNYYGA
jgi:hypothetical protein